MTYDPANDRRVLSASLLEDIASHHQPGTPEHADAVSMMIQLKISAGHLPNPNQ